MLRDERTSTYRVAPWSSVRVGFICSGSGQIIIPAPPAALLHRMFAVDRYALDL